MVQTVNRHFLHQIKHNHDPKHPNLHLPCFGPMHEGTEHILQPPDTRRRTLTDFRQMIVSCLDTKLYYWIHFRSNPLVMIKITWYIPLIYFVRHFVNLAKRINFAA